jgi:hypothetical protein
MLQLFKLGYINLTYGDHFYNTFYMFITLQVYSRSFLSSTCFLCPDSYHQNLRLDTKTIENQKREKYVHLAVSQINE